MVDCPISVSPYPIFCLFRCSEVPYSLFSFAYCLLPIAYCLLPPQLPSSPLVPFALGLLPSSPLVPSSPRFPHLILSTLTIGLISCLSHTAAAITFIPPNEEPPRQTQGGASRGDVTFIPPSDDPPINTGGAGSRDSASELTALLPSGHYGQTTQGHPSFFVYVPRTSARLAFFTVLTEDGEGHYQGYVPITEMGVMRLELPDVAPALDMGQTYEWHFALVTEERLRPDSPRVSGWVRRVAPDEDLKAVVGQSKGRRSLSLANAYGRQGIWYDALSTLADLRQTRPDASAVSQSWDDLLNQVGLAAIANEPFLDIPD